MRLSLGLTLFVAVVLGAAPVNAQTLDLRRSSDIGGLTEISFCSRPSPNSFGFPGHSFVAFSQTRSSGARSFRAVGHTVGRDASTTAIVFSYFGGRSVQGAQAEELYTHLKQACMIVMVDRSDYETAITAARPTLTALGIPDDDARFLERYSLNGNDCIDFIIRVARTLQNAGLRVPARTATDTPASYISKLRNAQS